MTEHQLQAQCTQWYWNEYRFTTWKRMLHCNDNNSINKIEGNKKKALGVISGVSDLELIADGGQTWYIELKLPGEDQSPEQIEFMKAARERGHIYIIIYSFVEFQKLIKQIIGH